MPLKLLEEDLTTSKLAAKLELSLPRPRNLLSAFKSPILTSAYAKSPRQDLHRTKGRKGGSEGDREDSLLGSRRSRERMLIVAPETRGGRGRNTNRRVFGPKKQNRSHRPVLVDTASKVDDETQSGSRAKGTWE